MKIYFRQPTIADATSDWYKWLNDKEVTKYQDKGIFYNSEEDQIKYLNKMIDSRNDVIFAVICAESDLHIGSVGLHNIDWIHRSARLGIMIGNKDYWGKGYGKIAWNMITEYGLFVLNLHRIYADIMVENIASIKSAEASGFKKEGVIRDKYFKNGRYHTAIMMSVLKDEFIGVK